MSLAAFSPATRAWFEGSFEAPTDAQTKGWEAIAEGRHTLLLAPTGSGKTLAAFLAAIDRLTTTPPPSRDRRTTVLYISPLRALAVDIEKNLRAPLAGIQHAAERGGLTLAHVPTVGVRTGDTDARERRRLLTHPPDILITTPESLYLMLTSSARETLRSVRTVIVDEIHAIAATKRGAHLMLSLERLEALMDDPPQRIGLSATQRPLEEIARLLGGFEAPDRLRDVAVVDAGRRKTLALEIIVPVDDMADLSIRPVDAPHAQLTDEPDHTSIWPSIHPVLLDLIRAHRSTIVFVNNRRSAERLASRLNELADEDLVRAHHGSIAREQRLEVEDALKGGRLRGIVATSSLELGIDMGAVDLVVQVEAPPSVAGGLQRIGRAGHQVGAPSVGKLIPKYRGDLLQMAVVAERMLSADIESTRYPRNPLDVLAQQLVAMSAVDEWRVEDLFDAVRRCASFAELSEDLFLAVLDMLAGRYPSDAFAELRPRIVWDRATNVIRAREGAGRLAIVSGGTIPDRGLFGVFMPDGTRVGELDEECVYESRRGEVILLGASAWRIEDITRDRVVVVPAPGEHGKLPFWKAPGPGRPIELGRAIGRFTRELRSTRREDVMRRLREDIGLDERAARNLVAYIDEQSEATGARSRTIGRSSSNASATSWATGGSASCPRSARACMPPGRSRSRLGCRSVSGPARRCCGPTTGSSCGSPRPSNGSRSRISCSSPTRSKRPSSACSRGRRCSPPSSERSRPERCCSRVASRDAAPPSGSSGSGAPISSGKRAGTRGSRCCSRPRGSACAISSTCRLCAR